MSWNVLIRYGILALVQLIPQSLAGSGLVLHEPAATLPYGWTSVSTPAANTQIQLTIALTLRNIDLLESHLQAISSPGSPSYGQYVDSNDIAARYGPSDASFKAITSWLQEAKVTGIKQNTQSISFVTTVSTANDLLGADFKYYIDSNGNLAGATHLRTMSYSVPDDLKDQIDLIWPTTSFGTGGASRKTEAFKVNKKQNNKRASTKPPTTATPVSSSVTVAPSCQTSITPSCLKQMYNIGDYAPDVSHGSRVAFASFLNASSLYSDLPIYEDFFNIASQNLTKVIIDNATNSQRVQDYGYFEANLDAQCILAVSHPLLISEFLVGGEGAVDPSLDANFPNEPYVPFFEYLMSQTNDDLPQVISMSYADDEDTVPYKHAARACNLMAMAGLRGISILTASGDDGVGSSCMSNDGQNRTEFASKFPAACPYITAVGGTQSLAPEIAWNRSSGGFSKYLPRAWYQQDAIETYLGRRIDNTTKDFYSQYTNFSARGFPDVAAHAGEPYIQVFYGNVSSQGDGTSAASPTVAGIVALLNDARLAAGKPTLGFLNPLFYSLPQKFVDITGGQSMSCDGTSQHYGGNITGAGIVPGASWDATPGWDPATGLGTPNF